MDGIDEVVVGDIAVGDEVVINLMFGDDVVVGTTLKLVPSAVVV